MESPFETCFAWRGFSIPTDPALHWRRMSQKTGKIERVDRDSLIKHWKLVSRQLVCAPDDTRFVNPLRLPDIGDRLFQKWKRQQHLGIGLAASGFILSMLWTFLFGADVFRIGIGMSMIALFIIANDYASPLPRDLGERSEFFCAVIDNARWSMWFILAMTLLAVLFSRFFLGPFEDAAYASGAIITDVLAGEVWRIITGSFVHHTIQHWIINCVMLAFVFPLISFYSLRDALLCFVAGTLVSQLLFIALGALGWHQGDLLVGFSGGVYALMGYLLMDSCLIREKYPRRFVVLVLAFCFLTLAGTSLLNPNASLIAHVSGFLSGIVIFAIAWQFQRDGGGDGKKRRPLSGGCH